MKFPFPYSARIMGCLPGHDPVEIFRTSGILTPREFRFYTRDTAPEWEFWVEHRQREIWVLGACRPIPLRTGYSGPQDLRIGPSESAALEAAGCTPAYKQDDAHPPQT